MKVVEPGDVVVIRWKGHTFTATFIKKDNTYYVFKLNNGYNIGLKEGEFDIERTEGKRSVGKPSFEYTPAYDPNKPVVGVAATGGTIAARVDYVTGAVKAEFTVEDLVNTFPEINYVANLKLKQVSNIFSENMVPSIWSEVAEGVYELLKETDGVVITHGTDTMYYTASYLSFALRTPKPVVLTGAQRSSDRPSSDAAYNLVSSLIYAVHGKLPGVFISMHGSLSDGINYVHLGTRVRKHHTSRRDTFRSIGVPPVAEVHLKLRRFNIESWNIKYMYTDFPVSDELSLDNTYSEEAGLIKYYPGMKDSVLERFLFEHRGVIIEGTGFGHVNEKHIPLIRQASESGVFVGITSQTIGGRTHPHVYSTAVMMEEAGAVYLEDMLPETAYAKLVWVLGKTDKPEEVKRLMLTNISGEITARSDPVWK